MAWFSSSFSGKSPKGLTITIATSMTSRIAGNSKRLSIAVLSGRDRDVSTTLDDRRIAEWLFLLTFAAAAYFYGGAGWSQNATFDVTRAIVERHTFAIDAYAANTGDRAFANGHVYANKAPALAV